VLACVLALAAFARAATFSYVTWDDPLYVTSNPLVLHPLGDGLGALLRTASLGYPVPVVVLSFALDHAVFGFDPGAMHVENLALHLVNVVLVFACARALSLASRWAGIAALLFAVHPLVVEPVCWVTGRKDLLATALVLGAVLVVARGRDAGTWRRWLAATAMVALAILAKPSAVTAPAALALTAWMRESRPPGRVVLARAAPAFAVALALGLAAFFGERHVGAIASRRASAVPADLAASLAIQLGHLVWPRGFAISYMRLPGDPSVAAMAAASLAVVAVGVLAWRRGTTVERWGLLFALVAYVPASGLVQVNREIGDSYAYLPLAGLAVAVGALASRVPAESARAMTLGAAAVGLVLAALSFGQTSAWASPEAVWQADTRRYPKGVYGWMELGRVYAQAGRARDAADAFASLGEEVPDFDDAFAERAAWLDRGGRHELAVALLERGVREGDMHSVRDYWLMLLRDPNPPPPDARDVVARAFDLGFDAIRGGIDQPQVFDRIAAVLQAEHLDDRAARAHEAGVALMRP